MGVVAKVVRSLGWVWLVLAFLLNLAVHAMILYNQGFWALQEELSPYNVRHYITVGITFAPGVVLVMLADAIQQRRRGAIIGAIVALPVAVLLVVVMGFAVMSSRTQRTSTAPDDRTREYKAASVRVLNRSAVMNEHKNYGITSTSGPVGQEGIPETMKLGDEVTVKGRTVRVRHIFVTEFNADMKWGGQVLAKKGDVHCVLVESEENIPRSDDKRDRLWIFVPQCELLARL